MDDKFKYTKILVNSFKFEPVMMASLAYVYVHMIVFKTLLLHIHMPHPSINVQLQKEILHII